MVIYAFFIWWPYMKQFQARNLFQKVQRLAWIHITGVMNTCSTEAMEAIKGLTPLHLIVNKEAMLQELTLNRSKYFKLGDLNGDIQILNKTHLERMVMYDRRANVADIFNVPKVTWVKLKITFYFLQLCLFCVVRNHIINLINKI